MGVTIHYAVGMRRGRVQPTLDRAQALAEQIQREQAAPLSVPFTIRRTSPTTLYVDIGECETLSFEFNPYEQYGERAAGEALRTGRVWSYEQSVLNRVFDRTVLATDDERLKRWPEKGLMWAAAFCKTQFAASLAEHRWVAELIRSIASVAEYAHVYDEGAYYHTLEIEDAAEAIHANGVLINSIGGMIGKVIGQDVEMIKGGETTIKPSRKSSGDDPSKTIINHHYHVLHARTGDEAQRTARRFRRGRHLTRQIHRRHQINYA
jgi:hypothetical protein